MAATGSVLPDPAKSNGAVKGRILTKGALYKTLGYEVHHPEVMRFHQSNARVKVCVAPRRTTKSYSAAYDVIPELIYKENFRVWIVGPSYALAEKEFRYIHEAMVIKHGITPLTARLNARSELRLEFPGNRIVEGKSAENANSLLGEAVDVVIYSEAAELPRIIRERYVAPTLNTKRGREIIPTTPQAKAEWVYELFEAGQKGVHPEIQAFQWDRRANPVYNEDEFNRAKAFYGEDSPVFREQYLGEWVFYGGMVYSTFAPKLHIIKPFNIPASWRVCRGIDFGHRDPFVCLFGAVGPGNEVYIFQEYYNTDGKSIREHAAQIKALSAGYNISETVGDPQAKQSIEDLCYEGVSCDSGENDRQAGRMRVLEYLLPTKDAPVPWPLRKNKRELGRAKNPNLYIFDSCKELLREFKFYRWKEGAAIENNKEKTEGDDHAMDALRYLLMTRPSPMKTQSSIIPGSFDSVLRSIRESRFVNTYIR